MNHTPQRTRRKTTKRKRQRRKPLRGRFALLGAAVLLVLLLLRCGADEPQPGSAAADETAAETTAETQPVPATQAADPPSKDDPLLLLVSRAHPLAEDYAPELTQLHDWPYSIAAIAYEPLRQMLAAGRAEGLSFTVASAYRSTDSQRQLFDEDVEARVSEGMTEDEAREETARWTMPPGCSEHETGLAVDIVATDNQRLDDTQEQTPETIWLHENCWRFGFILRYPAGKEDVTGIDYESWHYRYVGIEAARYLTEQQLTLDDFGLPEGRNRHDPTYRILEIPPGCRSGAIPAGALCTAGADRLDPRYACGAQRSPERRVGRRARGGL